MGGQCLCLDRYCVCAYIEKPWLQLTKLNNIKYLFAPNNIIKPINLATTRGNIISVCRERDKDILSIVNNHIIYIYNLMKYRQQTQVNHLINI